MAQQPYHRRSAVGRIDRIRSSVCCNFLGQILRMDSSAAWNCTPIQLRFGLPGLVQCGIEEVTVTARLDFRQQSLHGGTDVTDCRDIDGMATA